MYIYLFSSIVFSAFSWFFCSLFFRILKKKSMCLMLMQNMCMVVPQVQHYLLRALRNSGCSASSAPLSSDWLFRRGGFPFLYRMNDIIHQKTLSVDMNFRTVTIFRVSQGWIASPALLRHRTKRLLNSHRQH